MIPALAEVGTFARHSGKYSEAVHPTARKRRSMGSVSPSAAAVCVVKGTHCPLFEWGGFVFRVLQSNCACGAIFVLHHFWCETDMATFLFQIL